MISERLSETEPNRKNFGSVPNRSDFPVPCPVPVAIFSPPFGTYRICQTIYLTRLNFPKELYKPVSQPTALDKQNYIMETNTLL